MIKYQLVDVFPNNKERRVILYRFSFDQKEEFKKIQDTSVKLKILFSSSINDDHSFICLNNIRFIYYRNLTNNIVEIRKKSIKI